MKILLSLQGEKRPLRPQDPCFMRFRTEIPPFRAPFTLSPEAPAVMLGSCFSDHVSTRMRAGLWKVVNPFGTLFNPISIAAAVRLSLLPEDQALSSFRKSLFGNSPVHSRFFGSRMSGADSQSAEQRFIAAYHAIREALASAEALFVTFGTAWVYALSSDPEMIVGNCHKQPASFFIRRRLSVQEIVEEWSSLASVIRSHFPNLHLIFTVSPVRHLKDGFEGNSRSKAVLQLAIEQLLDSVPDSFYFPAFELINDDLRDYRFYGPDLVHPSQQAVDYVWERFKDTFLDATGVSILREGERITAACAHRPLILEPGSETTRDNTLKALVYDFLNRHPSMLSPL